VITKKEAKKLLKVLEEYGIELRLKDTSMITVKRKAVINLWKESGLIEHSRKKEYFPIVCDEENKNIQDKDSIKNADEIKKDIETIQKAWDDGMKSLLDFHNRIKAGR
jgi:hypothetical protein